MRKAANVRAAASGLDKADDIEYLYRIRCHYASLSKKRKRIADYILAHQDELPHSSINLLAKKIGTNASGVTRFCQALGFKGFSELKFYMRQEFLSPFARNDSITREDSTALMKQKMIAQDKEIVDDTIALLEEYDIQGAVRLVSTARRLDIFAEGGSAASAMAAYTLFMQLAIPCRLYSDAFIAITSASQMRHDDVALVISYSGSASNSVNFAKMARERGASVIAITGYVNSPVTHHADISLYCSSKVKNDLRDMHIARLSELCIIGLLHVGTYAKNIDQHGENLENLIKATRITRLKNGHHISF